MVEEELSLMGSGNQGTRRKSVAVMPRVRAVWLTFAIVDGVGDRNASNWLLVVFTIPVRTGGWSDLCIKLELRRLQYSSMG